MKAIAVFLCAWVWCCAAYGASSKPNIIFILVDDMGWSDTSQPFHYDKDGKPVRSANNGIFKTPGMERIAAQGVCFTNAYAASVCSPSRTAIMTGLNPSRTHVTNWTHPAKPEDTSQKSIKEMRSPVWRMHGLTSKDPSMARMFKKEGYATIFVGKAHFGPTSCKEAQPLALGFDVNVGGCGAGQPGSYYASDNYSAGARGKNAKLPMGPRDVPHLDKYYGTDTFLTDALTKEVSSHITKAVAAKKPFFAYYGHYAVHGPLMEDPQFIDLYKTMTNKQLVKYATLMSGADKSILDLIALLEKLGVAENTLIVFASDNGGTAPKPQPCAPLRNMKGTPYEGGVRTPVIMAWAKPSASSPIQKDFPIQAGSRNDRVIALQDMFATFGSMIGSKNMPKGLDSQDISGFLRPEGKCNRTNTYFLNFPHEHTDAYYVLYRNGDWKVIYRYLTKKWELYNLAEDLGEKTDLAATHPDVLQKMAAELIAAHKAHNAQTPIDTATNKPVEIATP